MSEFANKSRRRLQFPNEPRIITATSPEMKAPPKPQKLTYEELETENARLRTLIDNMVIAANQLVTAARPHCPTDPNLAQAWRRMRGSIPIVLAGSVLKPAEGASA